MRDSQQLPLGKVGTNVGLVVLWIATTAWLLVSGAFTGYLLVATGLVGGVLLVLALAVWLLLLRWGVSRIAEITGNAVYEVNNWPKRVYLGFVLTQLLVAIWIIHSVLG
jgi:hypothetical protein